MVLEHQRTPAGKHLELPTLVFGPVELHRLQRELEALEEFLEQAELRKAGKQPLLPKMSRLLEALAGNNNLNLLVPADRQQLVVFLKHVSADAPVVHVSFAADPSSAFTAKVVAWFRANAHPYTLLQLGLQPNIAAGCVVRTNNKSFDFSLRGHFHEKRHLLLEAIGGGADGVSTA
jgi:F0F1-type ATP synthase delta subunit